MGEVDLGPAGVLLGVLRPLYGRSWAKGKREMDPVSEDTWHILGLLLAASLYDRVGSGAPSSEDVDPIAVSIFEAVRNRAPLNALLAVGAKIDECCRHVSAQLEGIGDGIRIYPSFTRESYLAHAIDRIVVDFGNDIEFGRDGVSDAHRMLVECASKCFGTGEFGKEDVDDEKYAVSTATGARGGKRRSEVRVGSRQVDYKLRTSFRKAVAFRALRLFGMGKLDFSTTSSS